MKIYVIYDRLAEECGQLVTVRTDAVAVRMFHNSLSNVYDRNDYRLYCLGSLDVTTMQITLLKQPRELLTLVDKTAEAAEELNV